MVTRYAFVWNWDNPQQLDSYLPQNYHVARYLEDWAVIVGEDKAGWTLDDYVIPRLASGLIVCEEISARVGYALTR